jgi:surface protein
MFNEDILAWDVSKAINMKNMFSFATVFSQDLSLWNTSQVTTMYSMFFLAARLQRYSMFFLAAAFNGEIGAWDTSKVIFSSQ